MMEDGEAQERRFSRFWPIPQPMAARRSSASIPMRPLFSWPARALSRSSARCAFPSWTTRPSTSARQACEAEIEVNRPLAPEIYRGVVPITRDATARSRSTAMARRSNGRSRCTASTRTQRSTIWRMRARSMAPRRRARPRCCAQAHATAPRKSMPSRLDQGARRLHRRACRGLSAKRPISFRQREVEALASASRAAYARIRPLLFERGRRGSHPRAFTAICISATSCCSRAGPCCSMPSSSVR